MDILFITWNNNHIAFDFGTIEQYLPRGWILDLTYFMHR